MLVWGIASVAAGFPRAARADGESKGAVSLEWVAPSGCPTHDEMVDRIARIVGKSEAGEAMTVRAVVVDEGARGFAADVTMTASGQTNARHFGAPSCATVADAVALVVAIAVNPRAIENAEETLPPSTQTPFPSSTTRAASPSPLPSPASPPSSPSRRAVTIGASALVDASTLPSAGFGAELAAGWNPRHAIVLASLAYVASQSARLPSRPNEGADFALLRVGLRGCYELFDARLGIGPCAGVGLEWIDAHGVGAAQPTDATGRMTTASLGLRAIAHVTPGLALALNADGIAPFARPTFVIDNAGQVFHVAPLLFRASFGIELHF